MNDTHMPTSRRPTTLRELLDSGYQSKTVKREIHDNFLAKLRAKEELFPGMVGYESTVVPEVNIALLAQHDMLFLGEKGQGKSRLMRGVGKLLDEAIPFVDIPGAPLHDDPLKPITHVVKEYLASHSPEETPIGWWKRED